jgi:hypothetical protein
MSATVTVRWEFSREKCISRNGRGDQARAFALVDAAVTRRYILRH